MRQLIAYICILFISFQVIPVKEIGALLFKGQFLEEEIHSCNNQSSENHSLKLKKEGPLDYYTLIQNNSRIAYLGQQSSLAIELTEKLPIPFIADIVTPPPNSRS